MKKISKNTRTWQLYEAVFKVENPVGDIFNEETQRFEPAPITYKELTKGQAINLAMNLNSAQIQDFEEMGLSRSQITKSAKAKLMPGFEEHSQDDYETRCWMLEISVSYRHRARPGKSDDIMTQILNQALQNPNNESPLAKITRLAQGSTGSIPGLAPASKETPSEGIKPPVGDELFKEMFSISEEGKGEKKTLQRRKEDRENDRDID